MSMIDYFFTQEQIEDACGHREEIDDSARYELAKIQETLDYLEENDNDLDKMIDNMIKLNKNK